MSIESLIQMLERRSGHGITSASDCEWLALDFRSRAGETIGVNTLKRLLGFLDYDGKAFRTSTLDIVARYLGLKNWAEAEEAMKNNASDFGYNPDALNAEDLCPDDTVTITYKPDRKVTFKYLGGERFVVTGSINSKLQNGDVAIIRQFVLGYPLLVADVIRNNASLGEYTAAKIGGLTSINDIVKKA